MRYIIFDRDGTLIQYKPYLHDPNKVKLTNGAKNIISNFLKKGYLLFLHTNQSGVSRGYFKMEDVNQCNNRMIQLLGLGDEIFEDICIAEDFPPGINSFRKPSTKFGEQLIEKYKIRLDQLIYIGDNITDLDTAFNLNCQAYGLDRGVETKLKIQVKNERKYDFKVFNSLLEIENDIIKNDI